jgi:hypothetical protein
MSYILHYLPLALCVKYIAIKRVAVLPRIENVPGLVSALTSAIMTEAFRDFSQPLQAIYGIVPQLSATIASVHK